MYGMRKLDPHIVRHVNFVDTCKIKPQPLKKTQDSIGKKCNLKIKSQIKLKKKQSRLQKKQPLKTQKY